MRSGTFTKRFAVAALATTALSGGVGTTLAADTGPVLVQPAQHTWNLLFGATVTSEYISRGLRQSEGIAVQPWAELDIGPVYLGYWGSNVSPSLIGSSWEHDLSIGVRGNHGPVGWDVGYVRYIYNNGDCCGEIYFKGTVNPIEPLTLGASIFYDPENTTTYVEGNVKLAFHNNLSVSGAIGSWDGDFSWNAGLSWQPHEWLTLDGRYHGGGDSNKFVASVSFATDLNSIRSGSGPLY